MIPSRFGRIVYLANLREPITGAYRHDGLAEHWPDVDVTDVLRRAHRQEFTLWLESSMQQKHEDLTLFVRPAGRRIAQTLATWRECPHTIPRLIPDRASHAERLLFLSDLHALMDTLIREAQPKKRSQERRT